MGLVRSRQAGLTRPGLRCLLRAAFLAWACDGGLLGFDGGDLWRADLSWTTLSLGSAAGAGGGGAGGGGGVRRTGARRAAGVGGGGVKLCARLCGVARSVWRTCSGTR